MTCAQLSWKMERMNYISRSIDEKITRAIRRDKSVLLLGPRQTGKTTLLNRLNGDFFVSFVNPGTRQRYEKRPSILRGEIEAIKSEKPLTTPLVLVDEVQKIPVIMDVLQDLIDRKIANVIITGSSARKLRRDPSVNLLPGRVVHLRLDPLTLKEMPDRSLEDLMFFGSLPGIINVPNREDREIDLESYVTIYLEEEIRSEAIVRKIGPFARFLEYAASESGRLINFRKLSQEIGVAHTTIASYFEILEDCLVIDRIEPITESKTRKKLTRSNKYLFFDLGVRRLCAREGTRLHRRSLGHLFEQAVGLELLRLARLSGLRMQIRFWRDPGGPEVDWVIDHDGVYIPIEVKWTDTPAEKDIKYLETFLREYPAGKKGYLVCRIPRRIRINERISAIPWQDIAAIDDLID